MSQPSADVQKACCSGRPVDTPLIKTLTFAAVHFTVAFSVVYLLTGNWVTGGLVALIEPACNACAYYFHERLWASRF